MPNCLPKCCIYLYSFWQGQGFHLFHILFNIWYYQTSSKFVFPKFLIWCKMLCHYGLNVCCLSYQCNCVLWHVFDHWRFLCEMLILVFPVFQLCYWFVSLSVHFFHGVFGWTVCLILMQFNFLVLSCMHFTFCVLVSSLPSESYYCILSSKSYYGFAFHKCVEFTEIGWWCELEFNFTL